MTRGRPREFDKAQALDTAMRMFWRHGYEGASVAALAGEIGVTVPSLYLAFGNKESLFMQAVAHYGLYSECLYEKAFARVSAREVALDILMGEVALVSGRDTPDGCLMIQGALATSPDSEAVQQAMAKLRRDAESAVAARFERARQQGDLPAGWEPQSLASYVMTVAAGIAVQAKTGLPRRRLQRVAEMAMLIWPEGPQASASRRRSAQVPGARPSIE
ncbi:TetR/AcrR family transcriptional regulator [Variovorax sp. J22P168]|uniref:TetR/AcrR family transcriptional regulator n=1 Tax=Variovorax jilinensis TaxID=3053513 RepID=UPI0025781EC1|nr:TetR/AcrR family transcriptional regulator [Variovorax sp. J22P168]MDM0015622.1 TetR/AcrR family transcriptional regulator [Variovorax sp. J22P168]